MSNILGYEAILAYLYSTHYRNPAEYSAVTSSHWREVGWHKVLEKDGVYSFDGYGFGAYKSISVANRLRSIPENILLHSLFRKHSCSPRLVSIGKQIVSQSGHILSFDSAKQILCLDFLEKSLKQEDKTFDNATLCIIGDGYGFLSSLIKSLYPNSSVISVNLGKTLFFDVVFTQKNLPNLKSATLKVAHDPQDCYESGDIVFLEAEKFELISKFKVDVFISIASMQEMDIKVVKKYFDYMRNSSNIDRYFYCCNRLSKTLPDNSLTNFREYPWDKNDSIIVDELCPWYQKYPSSRPPFWHQFDGPVHHKLIKF